MARGGNPYKKGNQAGKAIKRAAARKVPKPRRASSVRRPTRKGY